ncbi:hypothetical protein V1514DRAFT_330569 [Lipomyces japonicus]|uniref:uncharacterized protein n=1 Tax=Lipomyces japonicus TaxID=56871 RepID=UPI0034CE0323
MPSRRSTVPNALKFLNQYPRSSKLWRFNSSVLMATTGLLGRLFLYGFHNVETPGLDKFIKTIDNAQRNGKGILTVANHISVLDDPVLWGLLPISKMLNPTKLRWSLGAANVCFTNKITSSFFSKGQVLCTHRFGAGPFQESLDAAVQLAYPRKDITDTDKSLPDNRFGAFGTIPPQWIHIFPEALVHQVYPPHDSSMKYFHWGISRIVLEAEKVPVIVPIFHQGLEQVLPEDRKDLKYVPRTIFLPKFVRKFRSWLTGKPDPLLVTLKFGFGEPVADELFAEERQKWQQLSPEEFDGPAARMLRSKVAAKLREQVSQVRLQMGYPEEDARLRDHAFWSDIPSIKDVKIAGLYGNSNILNKKDL